VLSRFCAVGFQVAVTREERMALFTGRLANHCKEEFSKWMGPYSTLTAARKRHDQTYVRSSAPPPTPLLENLD